MLAPRKLKPGQSGIKELLAECGSRLLCVRYRCDPESQSIIKTVEIIVEESARNPRPRRLKAEQLVAIRIGWKEYDLQRQVKQAEARWNPAARLWELRYDQVVRLGLTERIVKKASTGKSKFQYW
ncbi:MAG: hypothetical protein U0Z53_02960 [Blastocatellia bacterium]